MGPFGTGLRRICAVVAAGTAAEMSRLVRAALRHTSTVELRLDWLHSDVERARFLRWLGKRRSRGATFLATLSPSRRRRQICRALTAKLYWLIQAREAGCQWCDLEVETLRKLPASPFGKYPVPPRVMLSCTTSSARLICLEREPAGSRRSRCRKNRSRNAEHPRQRAAPAFGA